MKFKNYIQSLQYLANITNKRVIIADMFDRLIKKFENDYEITKEQLREIIDYSINKLDVYINREIDGVFGDFNLPILPKKYKDKVLRKSTEITLDQLKNDSYFKKKHVEKYKLGNAKEEFFITLMTHSESLRFLLFLKDRYPNYYDENMLKWIKKDIESFKTRRDLENHINVHIDIVEEDDNGYPYLLPKDSSGKKYKRVGDLKTVWEGNGLIIKLLDDINQIPSEGWSDLECLGDNYCITVSKNYFNSYGDPPFYWVLEKDGDKYIQRGMIIPSAFKDNIEQALRNKKNTGIMEYPEIKKISEFLKNFIKEDQPPTEVIEEFDEPDLNTSEIYFAIYGKYFKGKWSQDYTKMVGSAVDKEDEEKYLENVFRDWLPPSSIEIYDFDINDEIIKEAARTIDDIPPEETIAFKLVIDFDKYVDNSLYFHDYDDLVEEFGEGEAKELIYNRFDVDIDKMNKEEKEEFFSDNFPMYKGSHADEIIIKALKERGINTVGGGEGFIIARKNDYAYILVDESF